MRLELFVKLVIPDAVAVTAFHTLQRVGFKSLRKIERADYYKVDGEGSFEELSKQLGSVDVIVNANKHRCVCKRPGEPFPEKENSTHIVHVLVQDKEKDRGLLGVLRNRLEMHNIRDIETGTLWSLWLDEPSRTAALDTAGKIAQKLLYNPYYQKFSIMGRNCNPKVLLMFGSQSDSPVYEKLKESLRDLNINFDFAVCSAHRTPELVDKILEDSQPSLIIAGAGLAAHLPGVIASKTIKPVIGIPCKGNYQGLDALLSIVQMPPGVPVLCTGVENTGQAAKAAKLMLKEYNSVNFIGIKTERHKKATDMLKEMGVPFYFSQTPKEQSVNINCSPLERFSRVEEGFVINVPVAESSNAQDSVKLLELTQEGLWVGLNRVDNAALFAVQILNKNGKYEKQLSSFRKKMRNKIIANSQMTYKEAGVDIDAADESNKRIKRFVNSTFNQYVLSRMGSFGGAFDLTKILDEYKNPVLISSIDGVGTKLIIARKMGRWDTVGKDLVNHSANDILTIGAKPLFFLDYVAASKLKPEVIEEIIKGMSEACRALGMPLVAGETAEMPDVYAKGEHDLVGSIVGMVDRSDIIDGSGIQEGDLLVALRSSGLHTNGYSLARKVLLREFDLDDYVEELGTTVGDELLKTHRCYSKEVHALLRKFTVNGIAHITGGGLLENIPRILPEGLAAAVEKTKIKPHPVFNLIQKLGSVPEEDMYRTFNMGVGLVLIVPKEQASDICRALDSMGMESSIIGSVIKGTRGVTID